MGWATRGYTWPRRRGHTFKNAKADGSEPEGSWAAGLCDAVQGAGRGSSSAAPAPTRRGHATSSMPANKESWPSLGPGPSPGAPVGVSRPDGSHSDPDPCSLEAANLASASLASPGTGGEQPSRAVAGTAVPREENRAELRGCRKAWPPARGRASVSRSDGPPRAAAGPGSARGLRAGGHCRQEASKCLRILVALLVTGPGLPALSSCSRGRARSRTRSWASRSVHPREAMAPRALICTRSLVPPRWRRSSSSTASQLRTPHLLSAQEGL